MSHGVAYFEATVRDEGLVRVGWASAAASLELGTDAHSFGFGGTGMKSHGGVFGPYGTSFGAGSVVGCVLDADAGEVSFTLAGAPLGLAFAVPPHLRGAALFPAVCLKNAEVRFNFGAEPFAHPPPGGAFALCSVPLQPSASVAPRPRGSRRTPRAIVLEPVRDLAEQTHAAFKQLGQHLVAPALVCALCVGGAEGGPSAKALRDGCDVVTGTPKRVLDLVTSGKIDIRATRFLVLDEADRLLEAGSADDILALFRQLPRDATAAGGASTRLQVLLFSATLHAAAVRSFADAVCDRPSWVDLKGADFVPDSVHHAQLVVDPGAEAWQGLQPVASVDGVHACDGAHPPPNLASSAAVKRLKPHLLLRLLDALQPDQAMVFCRTNLDCDHLEAFLRAAAAPGHARPGADTGSESPYSALVLAGARAAEARTRNLAAFKAGKVRLLICTDVAARGIDVTGLPLVVNMTLPDGAEDYIHRVGRVGRADALGLAVSLVSATPERVWFCKRKGHTPWAKPTPGEVEEHTVWLDEAVAMRAVEERLGAPVPVMGHDCALPPDIMAALGDVGAAAYGQQRAALADQGVATAVDAAPLPAAAAASVLPTVAALSELEFQVQQAYWSLKRKFTA